MFSSHFSFHCLPAQRGNFFRLLALLGGLLLLLNLAFDLLAEALWFEEVTYLQVFWVRLQAQSGLGLLGFGVSAAILLGNLAIAQAHLEQAPASKPSALPGGMKLRWLLPLTLALGLTIAGILLSYGQVAVSHWQLNFSLHQTPSVLPPTPSFDAITQNLKNGSDWGWGLVLAIALLVYPQFGLRAIALLFSLSMALVLSDHWAHVLPCFSPTPFDRTDPLFHRNLSFYIFQLPLAELLAFWLMGLLTLGFASVLLVYLLSGNSLSQGKFLGFSSSQQRHLFALSGCLMLGVALIFWLDRYKLLYSPTGAIYGAGYTDIAVRLPAYVGLTWTAGAIACLLFCRALLARDAKKPRNPKQVSNFRLPILLAFYLLFVVATSILPNVVQYLVVQPNELLRELPYIERSIALTRDAFELDAIEVKSFDLKGNLTFADLQRNDLTIKNIRLWDTRPLLQANRQLQRFRPYYEFPGADIDRYTLTTEAGDTEQQQVLIAARELDYNAVPADAKTWVNEHLIYTHGYGFTISPVNITGEGGLPAYLIQGIEHRASSQSIRKSIPIDQPRIYYGELTQSHIMTQTRVRELDYPSGNENIYNTYDGRGGIEIGSYWRRMLFAKHLGDWQMLLTQDFTPQTRLLFRRNIVDRVQAIAPFLRYDRDPYLVVADPIPNSQHPSYLYWMIDAYTISDRYPYSAPGNNDFNYIRNSVKVVVDAYNGSVSFYVADAHDPIIQTWSQIFPGLFRSIAAMPLPLRSHIRYPQDFFRIQSDQLMVYHMTDPQVFYNREDQWRAPNEIYGGEQRMVEPYYLIMKLPGETSEEFLLFRPFTPDQRTNLTAWLAARSSRSDRSDAKHFAAEDVEQRSGRMLLYRFTRQDLVYGSEQLEARINQDPVISQQISLWNRQGSRAVQGNLLVIPIEESLLYVEPLYLEAEQNQIPTLVRVIVAYGDRIAMAETLEQALSAIFQRPESTAPAIVRFRLWN
jgi:uncharacterized protein